MEQDVRLLAVEVLQRVNQGGISQEDLARAKDKLEEALEALNTKSEVAAR